MNKVLVTFVVFALIAIVSAVPVQQNAQSATNVQSANLELSPEAQPELLATAESARRARGFGIGGIGVQVGLAGIGVGGYPGK